MGAKNNHPKVFKLQCIRELADAYSTKLLDGAQPLCDQVLTHTACSLRAARGFDILLLITGLGDTKYAPPLANTPASGSQQAAQLSPGASDRC